MPDTGRGRPRLQLLDVDTEWLKARLRDRKLTQRQLAAALGRDAAIVTRALQGNRRFSLDEFADLCSTLRTSPGETLRALGYDVDEGGVTVAGSIRDGAAVSPITSQAGQVYRYKQPPPTARALVFEAKGALSPYHGAVLVYDEAPPGRPTPAAIGHLCIVEAAGQLTPLLGTLSRASSRSAIALTPFGSADAIELTDVLRASPVLALFFP